MPSTTRRRLVAAAAALGGGGYAGYRLLDGAADAEFGTWTPEPGTWPLPRYDPGNTAHNPHADPPHEPPARRPLASVEPPEAGLHPLVGFRLVRFGPGVAVASRGADTWTSLTDARARYAGLGPDGRLHVVERSQPGGSTFELVGYDGTDRVYRVPLGGGFPEWPTVGAAETYVGLPLGTVAAVDAGGRDWEVDGAKTALADGRLYAVGASDGVVAYEERTGPDRILTAGPERVWTGPPVGREATRGPAVADGRLVVGTLGPFEDSGVVAAYDAATGERLWEPLVLGVGVVTPAVTGHRGFATVYGADGRVGTVVALDLSSGEVLWQDDPDWRAFDPVVGGETLVVLGQVRDDGEAVAGRVRAYDAASGTVLWTERFEGAAPRSPGVALVEDRVLVACGGTLYELA